MATPNRLRGVDVLKVLADNGYSTRKAAEQLGVTPQAIRDWLRSKNCRRVIVCTPIPQERQS